jgi:hypothetical protein
MSEHEDVTEPLSSFERQLQSLQPAATLERDRLMFRAGEAARERVSPSRGRWWTLLATNAVTAVAASLLVLANASREQRVAETPAPRAPSVAPRRTMESPHAMPQGDTYLALRHQVMDGRWEEEFATVSGDAREKAAAPASYRELLEQFSQELR